MRCLFHSWRNQNESQSNSRIEVIIAQISDSLDIINKEIIGSYLNIMFLDHLCCNGLYYSIKDPRLNERMSTASNKDCK